jgi:hypothetical protein
MPCRVDEYTEEELLGLQVKDLSTRLTEVTELLCMSCQMHERAGVKKPQYMEAWWHNHKKSSGHDHPVVDSEERKAGRDFRKREVARLKRDAEKLLQRAKDMGLPQ